MASNFDSVEFLADSESGWFDFIAKLVIGVAKLAGFGTELIDELCWSSWLGKLICFCQA